MTKGLNTRNGGPAQITATPCFFTGEMAPIDSTERVSVEEVGFRGGRWLGSGHYRSVSVQAKNLPPKAPEWGRGVASEEVVELLGFGDLVRAADGKMYRRLS